MTTEHSFRRVDTCPEKQMLCFTIPNIIFLFEYCKVLMIDDDSEDKSKLS